MFDKINITLLRTHRENKEFGHGYACVNARKGMKEGWNWKKRRIGFKLSEK